MSGENNMICPNCKNEIFDESIFCSVCGYKVVDGDSIQKEYEKNKHLNMKMIISVVFVLCVIIIFGVCVYVNSTPESKYKKAEKAFANENYEKAINYYVQAGEYMNAVEKMAEAEIALHYVTAEEMIVNKDFENAKKELEFTIGYKDTENLLQQCDYGLGQIYFDKGEYILAAETFNKVVEYQDSKEKIIEIGKTCIETENYEEAKTVFEYVSEDNYIYYIQGMLDFNEADYESAYKCFCKVKDLYDVEEKCTESAYLYAKKLMTEKKYSAAKKYFKNVIDYEDSEKMVTVCEFMDAKADYDEGKLNSAKKKLEKLPQEYEYDGIKVSTLLEKLNNNIDWVSLTGSWSSVSGEASTNCKSKDGWYDGGTWSSQIEKGDYTLNIKCILNDDGTVALS
ncbi:MAG: hypothetical protein J6A75_04275 [Lachnospiraceae bacterium]|nr:hypothetical protein [Lachnospiraceae bacterium]